MARKRLPRSIRKFIRKEKARIRREVFDIGEQEKLIEELYSGFIPERREESKVEEVEVKKAGTKKKKGKAEKKKSKIQKDIKKKTLKPKSKNKTSKQKGHAKGNN